MMKRILLTVAYDGTNYHGWQIQPNGVTIEEKLNQAILELTGEVVQVSGSSRTDAGVHALCNMAVFDTESRIEAHKFAGALNARLPEDIRVMESKEVDVDFHPRFVDTHKTYEYRIYRGRIQSPIGRNYAHHVYVPLDVAKMQQASNVLLGEHDFKSFCSAGAQVKSTVRTLYEASFREEGDDLVFTITGNGFLFNMVRIIVGTLIEVGMGRISPTEMVSILEACDREAAGPTAPAKGLMLKHYEFV